LVSPGLTSHWAMADWCYSVPGMAATSCWAWVKVRATTNWWGWVKVRASVNFLGWVKVRASVNCLDWVKVRARQPALATGQLKVEPQTGFPRGQLAIGDASHQAEYD
jgi:hypothetical protein